MNLESDKRLNIQLRLDFPSALTGEARQAGGEDIESLSVVSEPECPALSGVYSALTPNSLMIGHHFSAPAFTSAPSASGVCRSRGKTSNPKSTNRDRTAGSASASTAAALSLPMTSFGVPLGAKIPYQADQEIFGSPSSAKSEFQVPAPNASRLSPAFMPPARTSCSTSGTPNHRSI